MKKNSFTSNLSLYKVIIFILFCTFFHQNSFGQNVNKNMAKTAAKNWMQANQLKNHSIAKITTEYYNDVVTFYTINLNPEGFLILSADKNIQPILGYSFDGIAGEEKNPQAEYWLNHYSQQIVEAIQSKVNIPVNQEKWNELLSGNYTNNKNEKAVDPLLGDITFNQGVDGASPYNWNQFCPEDPSGAGGHTLVGCVAVAMGQVMKKWNYPAVGKDQHQYQHSNYGTISASFENTNYQWLAMNETNADQYNAKLLFHTGVSVNMDYSISGSGANVLIVEGALTDYFYYKKEGLGYMDRTNYPGGDVAWKNKLKEELDAERPVIYDGLTPNANTGHAFVCDGYNDNDYFHFNWGWGGYHDGYYTIDDLTPGSHNYNAHQGAIFGIEPYSRSSAVIVQKNTTTDDDDNGNSSGNNNGIIEAGETVELKVNLLNIGYGSANSITATISSTDTDITILNASASTSQIESGTFTEVTYVLQVGTNCPDKDITLDLNTTYDEGTTTSTFSIHVHGVTSCKTCPAYDNELTPTPVWQTESGFITADGCRMYKVPVVFGKEFTFATGCNLGGATANFDTQLLLLNENCDQITSDDDGCPGGLSKITWTCDDENQNYVYLKVQGYGGAHGNFTLSYKSSYLTINPDEEYNFGDVTLNEINTQTFTITNHKNSDVEINSITITGDATFTTNNISTTISAGGEYSFDVIFTPEQEGSFSATLHIANNADMSDLTVDLTGNGKLPICNTIENLTSNTSLNTVNLSWDAPTVNGSEVFLQEDFESQSNSLPGWKKIDADNDGYNWVSYSDILGHGNTGRCISSLSWHNNSLTPDNYLITPNIEGATEVSYWVSAHDINWPLEHYAVMSSSTGTNEGDFGMLFSETLTAKSTNGKDKSIKEKSKRAQGTWYKRTVQLPQGTKYIAFRHYDCTDQLALNLDDVTVIKNFTVSDYTYNIYKDGSLLAGNVATNTFTETNVTPGIYNYCVEAVLGECVASQVCTQVVIEEVTAATWNGSENDNWFSANNWDINTVPTANISVTIPNGLTNYPNITAAAVCKDITIKEGAALLGVNYLTVSGTATIETSIAPYTNNTNGWNLIAAPVHNMEITGSDFQPVSGQDDFYIYDNPNNMWLNYYDGMNQTGQFIPSKGYLVAYHPDNAGLKKFVGTLNTATSYQPTINSDKWHLIGNPYPSAIDWSQVTLNQVSSPQRLNNNTGAYEPLTNNDEVALGEGIFVYAENASASISIPVTAQTATANSKSVNQKARLKAVFGKGQDVSIELGVHADATQNFDWQYDARYLSPVTNIPNLSAVTNDNIQVSGYVLNNENNAVLIPLYFMVYNEEEISFSFDVNMWNRKVILEDKQTGEMTDITANDYTFMANPADNTDRFVLHIPKDGNDNPLNNVNIYAHHQNVYIQVENTITKGKVTIFNVLGQAILSKSINQGSNILHVPHNGAYIVTVTSNEGVVSKKIVIE